MANIHKPDENIKTDVATDYVSRNNNATTAIYFSMQNYDLAWFIINCHSNAGGTLSCQMWQRVGAAGATATLKAAATTLVTANTIDVSLFARGEDFTATYTHIGLVITAAGGAAITLSAVICRLRARYKQATLLA
jgi:hypothetical protein